MTIKLSNDSISLLEDASKDCIHVCSWRDLNDGREVARWEQAFSELRSASLVQSRGYEESVFDITAAGYKVLDSIKIKD